MRWREARASGSCSNGRPRSPAPPPPQKRQQNLRIVCAQGRVKGDTPGEADLLGMEPRHAQLGEVRKPPERLRLENLRILPPLKKKEKKKASSVCNTTQAVYPPQKDTPVCSNWRRGYSQRLVRQPLDCSSCFFFFFCSRDLNISCLHNLLETAGGLNSFWPTLPSTLQALVDGRYTPRVQEEHLQMGAAGDVLSEPHLPKGSGKQKVNLVGH